MVFVLRKFIPCCVETKKASAIYRSRERKGERERERMLKCNYNMNEVNDLLVKECHILNERERERGREK